MNSLRQFTKIITRTINMPYKNVRLFNSDLYEPSYLEGMKPKVPIYDAVNIELSGYDYPILESFQKFINSIAKSIDVSVDDCWGLPNRDVQISTYKPQSEIINFQYHLKMYRRVLQVTDISSQQLPILIRAIEASTPPGVTVEIMEHAEHHDEERFIPDQELINLKHELDEIGGPRKTK